jgi:hypothetical protein
MEEKMRMCIMMGGIVKSLHRALMEHYLKTPIISRPPMGFKMQPVYGIPRRRELITPRAMEEIKIRMNRSHRLH